MKKLVVMILALMMLCLVPMTAMAETGMIAGGWQIAENSEVTEDVKAIVEEALQGLLGASYEPVALLGTQLVAGMNYCVLCRQTLVTPGQEAAWTLAFVYKPLEGKAELLGFSDLNIVDLLPVG